LDKAKDLLSFLPSNSDSKPPCINTEDNPERIIPDLDTLLPDELYQPFDIHQVIRRIVDSGYFFETMELHARNMITGFARFNGRPVGIVANQPMWMGGSIDIDASDKGARFIRFCDLFNIPLISLQDYPWVYDRF
jgi:propionyl-CoA carboxylase carboxyltransferase subunit